MARHTWLRSLRRAAEQTGDRIRKQALRGAAGSRGAGSPKVRGRSRSGGWPWAVAAGLVVALALSLLAGAVLAVHGPASARAGRPVAATVRPAHPAGPEPALVKPAAAAPGKSNAPATAKAGPAAPAKPRTAKAAPSKPAMPSVAKAGAAKAGPASVKKVVLRPGDTLWALARSHGTSVEELQGLNGLGRSTLIYAGHMLRLPAGPDAAVSARRAGAAPAAAHAPGGKKPRAKHTASVSGPKAVIAYARGQLGKPYVWGGTGPGGFDCSGLVMRAWQAAGVALPRTTWDQIHAGTATTRARLVPGDLVLAYGGGHVELYIGHGQVIHAPRPGTVVTEAPLPAPENVVAYRHVHA